MRTLASRRSIWSCVRSLGLTASPAQATSHRTTAAVKLCRSTALDMTCRLRGSPCTCESWMKRSGGRDSGHSASGAGGRPAAGERVARRAAARGGCRGARELYKLPPVPPAPRCSCLPPGGRQRPAVLTQEPWALGVVVEQGDFRPRVQRPAPVVQLGEQLAHQRLAAPAAQQHRVLPAHALEVLRAGGELARGSQQRASPGALQLPSHRGEAPPSPARSGGWPPSGPAASTAQTAQFPASSSSRPTA